MRSALQLSMLALLSCLAIGWFSFVKAAEHPGKSVTEHPGKPVTAEKVKDGIKEFVKAQATHHN